MGKFVYNYIYFDIQTIIITKRKKNNKIVSYSFDIFQTAEAILFRYRSNIFLYNIFTRGRYISQSYIIIPYNRLDTYQQ